MVTFWEQAAGEILNPLVKLWNSFVDIIPGIIAAIVILIIGYVIAVLIGRLVRIVLEKAGLDKWLEKAKLAKAIGDIKLSSLFGSVTKWFILVIFLQAAVDTLRLGTLSTILNQFVLWLPHLIVGFIVVIAGLFLGHYVSHQIEIHTKMKGVKFVSVLFKFVIVALAVIIALQQIGVEVGIISQLVLIGVGSLAFGIALAIGLSFGLGLKNEAVNLWKQIKRFF